MAKLAQPVAAILHVTADLGDESRGVGLTCLAWWGRKSGEFRGGADDGTAVGGNGEEAFEKVGKWCQWIHPGFPELEGTGSAIGGHREL